MTRKLFSLILLIFPLWLVSFTLTLTISAQTIEVPKPSRPTRYTVVPETLPVESTLPDPEEDSVRIASRAAMAAFGGQNTFFNPAMISIPTGMDYPVFLSDAIWEDGAYPEVPIRQADYYAYQAGFELLSASELTVNSYPQRGLFLSEPVFPYTPTPVFPYAYAPPLLGPTLNLSNLSFPQAIGPQFALSQPIAPSLAHPPQLTAYLPQGSGPLREPFTLSPGVNLLPPSMPSMPLAYPYPQYPYPQQYPYPAPAAFASPGWPSSPYQNQAQIPLLHLPGPQAMRPLPLMLPLSVIPIL